MASAKKHTIQILIPQILLIVVCIVIFKQSQKLQPPEIVTITTTATMSEDADVSEIFGVKIERNPSQSKLDQLGVTSWPTWAGGPSQIPWTFAEKETMYLLEGKVKVYCDGHDEEYFEIGAGDLVEFPKGMKITWHVTEAVKKHYNLDKS